MNPRFALLFPLVLSTVTAFADTDPNSEWNVDNEELDAPKQVESDTRTIHDKRLPPTLPGEEVNVGGKKMKVWTTVGPVPVSTPPEPWNQRQPTAVAPGGVGVIIDRDNDRRDRGDRR